jgi:hypothetical protein
MLDGVTDGMDGTLTCGRTYLRSSYVEGTLYIDLIDAKKRTDLGRVLVPNEIERKKKINEFVAKF